MSKDSVLAALRFYNKDSGTWTSRFDTVTPVTYVPSDEETRIRTAIGNLYDSPTMRQYLEEATQNGQTLNFAHSLSDDYPDFADGEGSPRRVSLNLSRTLYVFDDNGSFRKESDEAVIAHELGHLLAKKAQEPTNPSEQDLNSPTWNYGTESVDFENTVMKELNPEYVGRSSYAAGIFTHWPQYAEFTKEFSWAPYGLSFTSDDPVSVVRLGTKDDNNIDLSHRPGTGTNLIFGFSSPNEDIIRGGQGKDYIYGMGGADRIYGNAGDDLLSGGAGDDELLGGDGYDILYGGDGNDILDSGKGKGSMLYGGDGDDQILAQSDWGDTIDAGNGSDVIGVENGGPTEIRLGAYDEAADTIWIKADPNLQVTVYDAEANDKIIWNGYQLGEMRTYIQDQETVAGENGDPVVNTWFARADVNGFEYFTTEVQDTDWETGETTSTSALLVRAPDGGEIMLRDWHDGYGGIRLVGDDIYTVMNRDHGTDYSYGGTPMLSPVHNGVLEAYNGVAASDYAKHTLAFIGPVSKPAFMV